MKNIMKKYLLRFRSDGKGQSFMELAIVLSVLLTLLLGMVEFSLLLNNYITVVDASRQGARFASTKDPYNTADYPTLADFYTAVDTAIEGQKNPGDAGALSPILLNPSIDDIIVSLVTVKSASDFTRTTYHIYGNGNHASSKVDDSQITTSITASAAPTGSGLVIIEIFYACSAADNCLIQIFPLIQGPDYCKPCVEIYTNTIMPMSSIKPTPVPGP